MAAHDAPLTKVLDGLIIWVKVSCTAEAIWWGRVWYCRPARNLWERSGQDARLWLCHVDDADASPGFYWWPGREIDSGKCVGPLFQAALDQHCHPPERHCSTSCVRACATFWAVTQGDWRLLGWLGCASWQACGFLNSFIGVMDFNDIVGCVESNTVGC